LTELRLYAPGVLLTVTGVATSLFSVKTTWILTLISVKSQKFALLRGIRYIVSSLLIKSPFVYKYIVSLTKQDYFTMNNKDFTIPKNLLLNWLYSTERNVSLNELGKWLENNTSGQYKLVKNNIKTEAA